MTIEEMNRYRRQIRSSVRAAPDAKTPVRYFVWVILICAGALLIANLFS